MHTNISWFKGASYYKVRGWLEKNGYKKTSNFGYHNSEKTKGWQEFDSGTEIITINCYISRNANTGKLLCDDVYSYQTEIYDNKNIDSDKLNKEKLYESLISNITEESINNIINEDVVITTDMRDADINIDHKLNVELRNRLDAGSVKFSFRKKNNKLRRARGTCNIDTIMQENPDFDKWKRKRKPIKLNNPNVIRFYDLDKKDWRSCDVSRLLIIIESAIAKGLQEL